MMRFLAEENVSRLVVARLRAAGLDVTAIGETSSGALDNDVLATASREGRILITEDRDFGERASEVWFAAQAGSGSASTSMKRSRSMLPPDWMTATRLPASSRRSCSAAASAAAPAPSARLCVSL